MAFKGRRTANSQGRRKGRITRSMTSEVEETTTPPLNNELGLSQPYCTKSLCSSILCLFNPRKRNTIVVTGSLHCTAILEGEVCHSLNFRHADMAGKLKSGLFFSFFFLRFPSADCFSFTVQNNVRDESDTLRPLFKLL